MPATNKTDLLAVTGKEFEKLQQLIRGVEHDAATAADDDNTSIKDIVAHRAHWIDLYLGWYHDGQAGAEVFFPAKGYKWNELKRYNGDLRRRQADVDWPEACAMLVAANDRLVGFIEGHTEDELYGGPMAGAKNNWTAGRWAEAAGPSHYRSAAKYLRARLKELNTSRAWPRAAPNEAPPEHRPSPL